MTRRGRIVFTWKQLLPVYLCLGTVFVSVTCMVIEAFYGPMLHRASPLTADPATGQVVRTYLSTSRTGPRYDFFVTSLQWWLWTVLIVVSWVPLGVIALCVAWTRRPWRQS